LNDLNTKIIARQTAVLEEMLTRCAEEVLDRGHPADRFLARFFKRRRELGSRDRRFLSEAVFSFFRWLGWARQLKLTMSEATALGWMLDGTAVHPVIAGLARPDWTPVGDRTLDEKCSAVKSWFPDSPAVEKHHLLLPGFEKSLTPADGEQELFYETLQQRPPTWLRLRSGDFLQKLREADIPFAKHEHVPGAPFRQAAPSAHSAAADSTKCRTSPRRPLRLPPPPSRGPTGGMPAPDPEGKRCTWRI
jgi:hypothetical protein